MTIRKTSQEIKKEILDFLFEGPKGINEIAEEINSNWPTTNSYLEKLKEEGAVNEILITDKMKIYRRTDDPVYFSIPFQKEIRTKTLYILKEIQNTWKKETKSDLSKTALQKIAVDVIKSCNLDLPILEFHYGMTTCASFDESNLSILNLIQEPEEKKEIDECVIKLVRERKSGGSASFERQYQYTKYNMNFYSAKEKLSNDFSKLGNCKSNKEDINKNIQGDLINLSLNFPLKLERFYFDFEEFVRNAQLILNENKSLDKNIETIRSTFNQLWDKLTTFTYFNDSKRFIQAEKKQLFEQIKELNLNFKEMGYRIYSEELESLSKEINPLELALPNSEVSKQIQSLILEGLENEK